MTISVLIATGRPAQLAGHLGRALDNGVKVETTSLRAVGPRLSAPASDAARARAVNDELGTVAPKFVALTNDVVFDDVWRRADLSPRDRSLVTIAALAAIGDDDELDVYLRLGLESGLTRAQIGEAVTHVASTLVGRRRPRPCGPLLGPSASSGRRFSEGR